jgi:hypothetical protein
VKPGLKQFNGSQDLNALALAGNRDFRGAPHSTPSGMQGGILAEAGFVTENQRPAVALGFFLRLG